MKKNLTLKKITFSLVLGMLFLSQITFAQTTFEVTSPANIGGEYEMVKATFGGAFDNTCNGLGSITGELMIGDDGDDEGGTGSTTDGCQALVNDLTGKIALIDRSSCEFGLQCLNAQAAGAIAVIVCNNVAGAPIAMDPGAVGDQVTVPCLMMGMDDCNTIRMEIPTVEVSIYWKYDPFPGGENILWGGATGQGDFNGGLNGWTTVDDGACANFELWRWSANATATDGAFSTGGGTSQSPSNCNGAMAFDSDFYDNDGDQGNLGNGECPAPQTGELISPTIDLASIIGDAKGIALKFHQATRQFNSTYFVSFSNDDGANWQDIEINSDFEVNSPHINEIERVYLPCVDLNSSTFKLKFRWEANYYYWIVDNVQLVEATAEEANNLRVMPNFFAIAPNAVTPNSQVEPFSFLADVYNAGSSTQTGINLNVTIDDNNGEVFTADLPYDDIPCDSLVENIPFPDYFTPDGTINNYIGTYEITSDSVDFDPSDNVQLFSFSTSDTVFAKETGMTRTILPAASNWEGDMEPHSWAYGNFFHIVNGDDWNASSATFGIGNADDPGIPGRLLTIYLYKWDEDTNEDGNMDPDERTKVGFAIYEILGSEDTDDLITVPLLNFPSGDPGPVDIDSDQSYVLMVEYATNDEVDFALVASDVMNYSAMSFRADLDGIPEGKARYAALLGVNGDLESEPYSSVGFGQDLVPVVRLNIGLPVNTDNPLDPANVIQLSPNPTNNQLNLKIDLVETQSNVSIRILDINGRLIMDQPYKDMKNETLEFNVSDFANGTYFLHFITENGVKTERFVVQH